MTYFFLINAAWTMFVSPPVALLNIVLAAGSVWLDHSEAKSIEQHAARMRAYAERR